MACTVTAKTVQSEAVPTAQTVMVDDPSPCPVTVICVPFAETEAMVGAEFRSTYTLLLFSDVIVSDCPMPTVTLV